MAYGLVIAALEGSPDSRNAGGGVTLAEARVALHGHHRLLSAALAPIVEVEGFIDVITLEVGAIERLVSAVNVEAVRSRPDPRGEPWLWFYEDFLALYDSQARRRTGVYYTPVQVVQCMTRLVDGVLTDSFANTVVQIGISSVPQRVEFSTWALVGWRPDRIVVEPRQIVRGGQLHSTRLTQAGATLAEIGRQLAAIDRHPVAIGEMACTWVSRAMTYEYGSTSVRTTAEEAVSLGRGVCQDYAHVMLAVCHAAGVPARYVSGHLLGEGGSHAWVEVLAPASSGSGVIPVGFDPTHDRRVKDGYLTIAVGRDYSDVSPTSGTFSGLGPGELTVRKRLRALPASELAEFPRLGASERSPA